MLFIFQNDILYITLNQSGKLEENMKEDFAAFTSCYVGRVVYIYIYIYVHIYTYIYAGKLSW